MRCGVLLLSLLALAMSAGSTAAEPLKGYKGADAGRLVFGLAAPMDPLTNVNIRFRRVTDQAEDRIDVWAPSHFFGMWGGKATDVADVMSDAFDQTTANQVARGGRVIYPGKTYTDVRVLSLPPGQYEINYILVTDCPSMYCATEIFKKVRVPFEIMPGRSTYLGRLSVVAVAARNRLTHKLVFYRWVLNLNDQSGQDLPIAATHATDLGPVDHAAFLDTIGRLQAEPPGAPSDPAEPSRSDGSAGLGAGDEVKPPGG